MVKTKDHPGVYIPPPFIYLVLFLLSYRIQALKPLPLLWLQSLSGNLLSWILIVAATILSSVALLRFIKTGNTVVTIKPAKSLQTTGIYRYSRNPMYLALLLLYTGLACLVGNLWTLILIPVLILIMNGYVIRREEQYLRQKFEDAYTAYLKQTRRWI